MGRRHKRNEQRYRPIAPVAAPLKAAREHAVKDPTACAAQAETPCRFSGDATVVLSLLAGAFVWSYWPVFGELISAWNNQPDYSHGWFVVPLTGYMLWTRRSMLSRRSSSFAWGGAVLIVLSIAIRLFGSACYIDSVEAWSIPFWIAGAFWLFGGRQMLWRALPAVAFLGFMIPLPFHAEHMASYPLQRVATRVSCWLLQCLAQPAVQEGNVVLVGEVRLNIVEACSGLRIFMSILALAYLYSVLIQKPWWTKAALFAAVAPVAVAANAVRIAMTGVLHTLVSSAAAHRFSHDLAGWLMLPVAGAMLALIMWYVDRLIMRVETSTAGDLLRAGRLQPAPR